MLKTIKTGFKKYFITGLLVVVPLYITIYILAVIVNYMDAILGYLPDSLHPDIYLPFHIPGIGVILTIVAIFLVGLLTTNLLGKKLVEIGEGILVKIPFFRGIYKPIKQFIETFFVSGYSGFRKAVLIEFPSKGNKKKAGGKLFTACFFLYMTFNAFIEGKCLGTVVTLKGAAELA